MDVSYFGWNVIFQVWVIFFLGDSVSLDFMVNFDDLDDIDCNVDYKYVGKVIIVWGINYLCSIIGKLKNGLGLNNCGCVSCFWNLVIYWCNDVCCLWFRFLFLIFVNQEQDIVEKEFMWNDIVDGVLVVNEVCKINWGYDFKGCGSYDDYWNVFVCGDVC